MPSFFFITFNPAFGARIMSSFVQVLCKFKCIFGEGVWQFGSLWCFCLSNCVIFLEILVHVFGVHRTLNVNDLRCDHMFI